MTGAHTVTKLRPPKRAGVAADHNQDPMVLAQLAQARATMALARSIDRATKRVGPAADFVHGLGARLDALCDFLRKKGPWILASVPTVLMALGAITPNAAKILAEVLIKSGLTPH